MRKLLAAFLAIGVAVSAAAQDKVTLANGDVLTGAIKSLADGKLVINQPQIGDVTVPMTNVANIATADPVDLETSGGELLKRRIAGIENGQLRLEGGDGPAGSLPLGNLAAINPKPLDTSWTGSIKIGASYSSGNTHRRGITVSAEAVKRGRDDRINADASWTYAEDKSAPGDWDLTERRAGAGLKYDLFLSKRWYGWLATRVLGDTLADIQLRYTIGGGLGHQFIENDTTNLLGEFGLSYFNENYRSATPTEDYLAARVAYKLRHAFNDRTRMIHGTEAFPSLEDADDVYFQMTTELQNNLTDSMIAALVWVWDYDNTPAPGRDRSDHRVQLTVGWTF
jgi:putative salt-induced outer membrane protein YdiY